MIERLTLTQERLAGIARAILKVRDLPDPVGEVLEAAHPVQRLAAG